jgi:hypothetical protein
LNDADDAGLLVGDVRAGRLRARLALDLARALDLDLGDLVLLLEAFLDLGGQGGPVEVAAPAARGCDQRQRGAGDARPGDQLVRCLYW